MGNALFCWSMFISSHYSFWTSLNSRIKISPHNSYLQYHISASMYKPGHGVTLHWTVSKPDPRQPFPPFSGAGCVHCLERTFTELSPHVSVHAVHDDHNDQPPSTFRGKWCLTCSMFTYRTLWNAFVYVKIDIAFIANFRLHIPYLRYLYEYFIIFLKTDNMTCYIYWHVRRY